MASRSRVGGGSAGSASRSSSGPSTRVSGVRNSWLTLAKKLVFARSRAASSAARARSCSYARARPTAREIWRGDQVEEVPVVVVERQRRADADDQRADVLVAGADRQHQRLGRRRRPAAGGQVRHGDRGGACRRRSPRRAAPAATSTARGGDAAGPGQGQRAAVVGQVERANGTSAGSGRAPPRRPAELGRRCASARREPSSRERRSRRSPSTRPVVSLTMQKTPPTLPSPSRIGS